MALKEKLFQKIQAWQPRIKTLLKEQGDVKIDEVTIEKCIGGARDIKALVTDIS
jgi:citrate synthase